MCPPPFLAWLDPTVDGALATAWRLRLQEGGHTAVDVLHGSQALVQVGASSAPRAVIVVADAVQLLAALHDVGTWRGGPLSLYGTAPSAAEADALLAAGVCGWWPVTLDASALTSALALDRVRWQHGIDTLAQLDRAKAQLDERQWVDRAKGVLMSARGIGENEAFTLLRGAAMHANLRMGELSRSVTEAAHWADAMNRAGQLRMLSQRLAKLAVQRWSALDARRARTDQDEALRRLADNIAHLQALPTQGAGKAPWSSDLITVQQASDSLSEALSGRLNVDMLRRVDERAETLLTSAEQLIVALEAASGRRALQVINVCGRQRMRVQRVAKQALLAQCLGDTNRHASLPALLDDFEAALRELQAAPLSSSDIREDLQAANDEWLHVLRGLHQLNEEAGRLTLSQASDRLLSLFDRLTASYERSLQIIMA